MEARKTWEENSARYDFILTPDAGLIRDVLSIQCYGAKVRYQAIQFRCTNKYHHKVVHKLTPLQKVDW
jgi:hypothetical protein